MKRLTDEQMKRVAEEGSASAMRILWQEACRARESEAFLAQTLLTMVGAMNDCAKDFNEVASGALGVLEDLGLK